MAVLLSWKMSLLLICEILSLFLNTLTVDDNYSPRNRENSTNSKEIINKTKTFSHFLVQFLKSISIFEYLKKHDLRAYVFQKLKTAKEMVRHMPKNAHFGTPLDSQHVKDPKTPPKFVQQDIYHFVNHFKGN